MGALFLHKLPALLGVRPQTLAPLGSSLAHPVSREMAGRLQTPSAPVFAPGPFLPTPCLGLSYLHSALTSASVLG